MIYILAGIAKSGKSLIAHEILKTYHIQTISTDWIMMMLYHGNKDLKIDVSRSDKSVSRIIEPYINGLIKSLSASKKDILIEGVHIQPEFSSELQKKYPGLINVVFLGYKDIDVDSKKVELKKYAQYMDNPWYLNYNDEEFTKLVHYLIQESDKLKHSCTLHHQTYVEVNNIMSDKDHIIKLLLQDKD